MTKSSALNQTEIPRAATVLLLNQEGKVLAVSRKDKKTDFGLPGGKVDKDETDEEAAIREAKEETGLTVTNLRLVWKNVDSHNYWTSCYLADHEGEVSSKEEGVVCWVDRDVLTNGCFGEFNKKVFEELDRFLGKNG